MKLKRIRTFISFILICSFILCLVGCGKNEKSKNSDHVFAKEDGFNIALGSNSGWIGLEGDEIYFYMLEASSASVSDATASSADSFSDEIAFYKRNTDGGEPEKIGSYKSSEDDYMWDVFQDKDSNLSIVIERGDGSSLEFSVYTLDGGEFKENESFNSVINDSADDHFKRIVTTGDGKIYSVNEHSFAVYDDGFNKIGEQSVGSDIISVVPDKDGRLVIGCLSGESGDVKEVAKVYDPASNSFENDIELNVDEIGEDTLIKGAGKFAFYYDTGSAVYGYNSDSGKFDEVIDYNASDILAGTFKCIRFIDENSFVVIRYDDAEKQGECYLEKYNHVDPKDVDSRTVLKLGVIGECDDITAIVNKYNKSQDKYKVQIVDYSESEDPVAKMGADIASGNAPDIYEVSDGVAGMTIDQCIAKGYIEDLTPYLEKDKELSSDDFISGIYNTMLRDGKLYFTASEFTVNYIIANKNEVPGGTGWTYDEFTDYVLSKPEGTMMFYQETKNENLENLMKYCYSDFVFWDKGSCDFNSDEFKDVLKLCNTGANEETNKSFDKTSDLLKNGDMLFLNGSLTTMCDFDLFDCYFDGNVILKGYPCKEGNGLYTEFYNSLAISKSCANKDAAWDFVRIPLTEDYEGHNPYSGIPLRNDVYEELEKRLAATKDGKDKYGNDYMTFEGMEITRDDITITTHAYDDKDLEQMRTIIDSADGMMANDTKIYKIIEEEAANYFSGNKSLDDTCAIIQDRVSTYINESK